MNRMQLLMCLHCWTVACGTISVLSAQDPLLRDFYGVPGFGQDQSEYMARAEAHAKKLIAMKAAAAPTLIQGLFDTSAPHYITDTLIALGPDGHPAIKRILARRQVSNRKVGDFIQDRVVNVVEKMGLEGKPLELDLWALAKDERVKFHEEAFPALLAIGADPAKVADAVKVYLVRNSKTADLRMAADVMGKLGANAEPLVSAYLEAIEAQGVSSSFDHELYLLRTVGPPAASLVPLIVAHYQAKRSPITLDNLCLFLASVGPAAKDALPQLNTWLAEKQQERGVYDNVFHLQAAIACVSGKAGSLAQLPKNLLSLSTHPEHPDRYQAAAKFRVICKFAPIVAGLDRRAGTKLVPLLAKAVEMRTVGISDRAATALRDLGPLAKPAVTAMISGSSGPYKKAKPSTIPPYLHVISALRSVSPHDKRSAARLEELARQDAHLMIRNKAREALLYAELHKSESNKETLSSVDEHRPLESAQFVYRTWASADGNFTVVAKLVKVESKVIHLKRKDNGKTIKVPLTLISKKDQDYVDSSLDSSM